MKAFEERFSCFNHIIFSLAYISIELDEGGMKFVKKEYVSSKWSQIDDMYNSRITEELQISCMNSWQVNMVVHIHPKQPNVGMYTNHVGYAIDCMIQIIMFTYMQVQFITIMNLGGRSIITASLSDKAKLSKTRRMNKGKHFKKG